MLFRVDGVAGVDPEVVPGVDPGVDLGVCPGVPGGGRCVRLAEADVVVVFAVVGAAPVLCGVLVCS